MFILKIVNIQEVERTLKNWAKIRQKQTKEAKEAKSNLKYPKSESNETENAFQCMT